MTILNLSESEPETTPQSVYDTDTLSGNAAFYERLQGQAKKKGIGRYSWVALPIAAVAIIGVVVATSTPNRSADTVAAAPAPATPVASAPAAAPVATPDQIH
ncbi:MAG: hypothetical protein JWO72_834, partial [Caulobacteraceae bacterium]|nr:hypothetical protein [Caulobacteraceae bacterium]